MILPRARSRSKLFGALPVLVLMLSGVGLAELATPNGGSAKMIAARRTPIQIENARRGFRGWASGLFVSSTTKATAPIQGYASEVSAFPGNVLHLHVSVTPAARYRIQVFRLGWYRGAGARLLGCIPGCRTSKRGIAQGIPTPDASTREIDAHWRVTDLLRTRTTWVSGYYIAKLVLLSGPAKGKVNFVPFILEARARSSAILVQASTNTWEAYNAWGGKSLYPFNSTGGVAATKVSYNRPYDSAAGTLFNFEYPLVRFLERWGYDVSYTADVDTDQNPSTLLRHHLVVDSGHGEYWTTRMRDAFESAKSSGVDLMFLGADMGDWHIRYEDGSRTIVEYRNAQLDPDPDPAAKTVRFSQLVPPRPQCQLLGIQYQGGFRSDFPQPTDYHVNPAALKNPWFAGSGFTGQSTLRGLVGYEWDGIKPGCEPPALTALFHASGPPNADAVVYRAASGARVFSSGSLQFVWGLDDWNQSTHYADSHLIRFMRNAFNDLSKG